LNRTALWTPILTNVGLGISAPALTAVTGIDGLRIGGVLGRRRRTGSRPNFVRRLSVGWICSALVSLGASLVTAAEPCTDVYLPPELCVTEARSDFGMVATGSPEATRTAVEILERGGNAIDAAVAAAFTSGVVDSQSSGIGGVTDILIRLSSGENLAISGVPHSPANIDIRKFSEFRDSGRSSGYETIGVPMTLATLEFMRSRFGTIELAELLQPAIRVAERGYPLSEIQITKMRKYYDDLVDSSPYMRSLVFETDGVVGTPGDIICQPDLANTYRRIASESVRSFYFGRMAEEIEADMIRGGSFLRRSDLAMARVHIVRPHHTTYRGFDVFTFPFLGGAAVVSILNILETYPTGFLAEDSTERHQAFIEAFRISAVDAPLATLQQRGAGIDPLSKRSARQRATLIVPGRAIPEEALSGPTDPSCSSGGESTVQITVADSHGNVVSMTQTLGRSFGAKAATLGLGFPFNNFLAPYVDDKPHCPGYLRPYMPLTTDMAPTIVLKDGQLFAALGSPGSNKIPGVISTVISNMVDRGMSLREAVAAPRVLWGGLPDVSLFIEVVEPITGTDVKNFEDMGYAAITPLHYPPRGKTKAGDFGAVNAVAFDPDTGEFSGVGDPRRWGSAMGPRVVAEKGLSH
jgi:gamma-glutamyltranspeptidase/glutathione hydrolase